MEGVRLGLVNFISTSIGEGEDEEEGVVGLERRGRGASIRMQSE